MAGKVPAAKKAPPPRPGNFARRTRQKTSALHQRRTSKLSAEIIALTAELASPQDLHRRLHPQARMPKSHTPQKKYGQILSDYPHLPTKLALAISDYRRPLPRKETSKPP